MTRSCFQYSLLLNFSWTKTLVKDVSRFDQIFLFLSRTCWIKNCNWDEYKNKKSVIFKKIISSYKHDINFETKAYFYFAKILPIIEDKLKMSINLSCFQICSKIFTIFYTIITKNLYLNLCLENAKN